MLKLVGTEKDGSVADELVLVGDDDRPTKVAWALMAAELCMDIALAVFLAKKVFCR